MKKAEASPVCRQLAAEVIPALNLVHGLVGDQLLQHRIRGLPVDPPEFEKAAIEPGGEQGRSTSVWRTSTTSHPR
jgi:hypothetical protein